MACKGHVMVPRDDYERMKGEEVRRIGQASKLSALERQDRDEALMEDPPSPDPKESSPAPKKKKKRRAEPKEEEEEEEDREDSELADMISFLPRGASRNKAAEFLKNLMGGEGIAVKNNMVTAEGGHKANLVHLLLQLFLPEKQLKQGEASQAHFRKRFAGKPSGKKVAVPKRVKV